jgi:ribosomal protein L24E
MKTDSYRQKKSEASVGSKNPFYGKKHTSETKLKMSIIQKKITRRGKKCNFYGKIYHGKGSWYVRKDNIRIWVRSTWELKYAEYLDNSNINWQYESKFFPMVIDGKEVTYTPDFYLIDEDVYIEVKGYWRDDSKLKYDTFIEQYHNLNIKLLMRDDLLSLGITI